MVNFVFQQVICSREFPEKFFIDYYPIHKDNPLDRPYNSFNKIVGTTSLNGYKEKFGEYIYYDYGFSYKNLADGRVFLKFATKWDYPIEAIHHALTLDHSIEWYAVEENDLYVSSFYWEQSAQERIVLLGDGFYVWSENQQLIEKSLSDEDHLLWYFLKDHQVPWISWTDDLNLPRYFKV